MARFFDDAQFEYLQINTAVHDTIQMAMVCWFKSDDITGAYCLMSMGALTNEVNVTGLFCQGAIGGDPIRFQQIGGGGWVIADTTAGYTANNWHHACGIYSESTDRRVYLDGANKGVDANPSSPVVNSTGIGVMSRQTKASYMSGAIAEAAIYNLGFMPGALNVDRANNFETQVLPSLAAGYSPLCYPLGLIAYYRLLSLDGAGNDNDIVGGYDMAPFNVPTWVDHPRIILPTRSQLTQPRSVLVKHGKLQNRPIVTGRMKNEPTVTGKLKNEPTTTGKFKTNL